MYPTVTVEHLASVTIASDDSDDLKIYEFDREASMDVLTTIIGGCCGGNTVIGGRYRATDEVLAA